MDEKDLKEVLCPCCKEPMDFGYFKNHGSRWVQRNLKLNYLKELEIFPFGHSDALICKNVKF